MEDSIKEFIEKKCLCLSEYLTSMLSIQRKIKSPIEKMFYLEWHYQRLFSQRGEYFLLPQFQQTDITGKYIVDFLVTDIFINNPIIVIEIDGHDFHEKTKEQVRKDKIRERFITKNVKKFLRFSGSEVFENPGKAVNEVMSLINEIEKGG